MKHLISLLVLTVALTTPVQTFAATSGGNNVQSAVAVGVRQHTEHSKYVEYPFGDGDLAYGLAYEVHDPAGSWQFGLDYTPEATGPTNAAGLRAESVLTPHMNVMVEERIWRGGLGILCDYKKTGDKSKWGDFYWQACLGVGFHMSKSFSVDILAFHVFDKWGDITKFDVSELEYGAWLSYAF